jgi:hypothetical protein
MTLVDLLLKAASRDLETVPGKIHFVETMAKHVARIADPVERDHYTWRVAEMAGLPVATIRRQVVAR